MKLLKLIIFTLILGLGSSSCKKEEAERSYATVNVVNATAGLVAAKVNSLGRNVSWANLAGADASVNFATNKQFILFGDPDYPFTIVPASDTLKSVYRQVISNEGSAMYTLFTTGLSPDFENLLVKESVIPFGQKDSVVSVRFINLSPNSPAVNITLASNPTVNSVSGLVYKQYSAFTNFPLLKVVPAGSVTFQARNAVTNSLLASYTMPTAAVSPYTTVTVARARFNAITLVLKGTVGTPAYGFFPVAHYQ